MSQIYWAKNLDRNPEPSSVQLPEEVEETEEAEEANASKASNIQIQPENENGEENLIPKPMDFKMEKFCSSSADPGDKKGWVFVNPPSWMVNQSMMMQEVDKNKNEKSKAQKYIEDHSILGLLEYLVMLLVYRKPNNPYVFLKEFFDKLLAGKNDRKLFCAIPRQFHQHHMQSLFRIFDRERNGFITGAQYMNGMDYICSRKFANKAPEGLAENKITQKVFTKEGIDAVSRQIYSFLK